MTGILIGFAFFEAGWVIIEVAETVSNRDTDCPFTHLPMALHTGRTVLFDLASNPFF